jgi:hypothetical protein
MTAVEKFIEQLEAKGESWENVSIGRIQISINVEDYLKLIEQAKEMEKEQIKDAFHKNSQKWFCEEEAEQYYNETFNNKNNETRKRSWVL